MMRQGLHRICRWALAREILLAVRLAALGDVWACAAARRLGKLSGHRSVD